MNQVSTEHRIECESGKLLCRFDRQGLWLWCNIHRRAELITWGEIETIRTQAGQEAEIAVRDLRCYTIFNN
jgi:hypothetical protein